LDLYVRLYVQLCLRVSLLLMVGLMVVLRCGRCADKVRGLCGQGVRKV